MCDVHICDKLASKIAEAGPELSAKILPEHYLAHICECEICLEKIRQMIILMEVEPLNDHIM